MIGQKKEFFYDKISYEDDLFFLNEGSVSILFPEEGTRFADRASQRRDLRRDCLRQFFLLRSA